MEEEATLFDPYKSYKFVVLMEGKEILGVSKISSLKRSTEVITWNEGGNNDGDHKTPGRTKYNAITLERGVTDNRQFEEWALTINQTDDRSRNSHTYKRDLSLEVRDTDNNSVLHYMLYGCWVSEHTLHDLDASDNTIIIESLKIELDSWERVDIPT